MFSYKSHAFSREWGSDKTKYCFLDSRLITADEEKLFEAKCIEQKLPAGETLCEVTGLRPATLF